MHLAGIDSFTWRAYCIDKIILVYYSDIGIGIDIAIDIDINIAIDIGVDIGIGIDIVIDIVVASGIGVD